VPRASDRVGGEAFDDVGTDDRPSPYGEESWSDRAVERMTKPRHSELRVTFTVVPLTDDPDGTRPPRQLDSILALLTRGRARTGGAGASGSNTKRIAP
jgi:hypothetical protein